LGEFNQKGTTRTKWGTFEELKKLTDLAEEKNMNVYFDAVLNHKAAADHTEKCMAIVCDSNGILCSFLYSRIDRTKTIGDPLQISAWLGFDFPGRVEKYSNMYWHWYHFTGVDWVNIDIIPNNVRMRSLSRTESIEFLGMASTGQTRSTMKKETMTT